MNTLSTLIASALNGNKKERKGTLETLVRQYAVEYATKNNSLPKVTETAKQFNKHLSQIYGLLEHAKSVKRGFNENGISVVVPIE